MLKVSYAGCSGLYLLIFAQLPLDMCVEVRNCQKNCKIPFLAFKAIHAYKVIAFGANQKLAWHRKLAYNFLLAIKSNLDPTLHSF